MKIYIVTSGSYSDYGIDKVFLNKEKAEKYVKTSESFYDDRRVEEFSTSDDVELKEYHYVDIYYYKFTPYKEDDLFEEEKVSFKIKQTNNLDNSLDNLKRNYLHNYNAMTIEMFIKRPVCGNYDEDYLKDKYTKVCRDLSFRIKELIEVEGWTKDMVNTWLDENFDEMLNAK